ncbi:kinase-like protein, partial [Marasmius fiardii PR-910]
ISEIIAGIMYLHSQNIVHGDIKGANVLVDKHGQCYLGDFGLAVTSLTTTLLNSTTSGVVKGTTRWMAPELFITSEDIELVGSTELELSKHNTTKLARDIYAFACTIYEIIAGEPPFAQLTDVQVMFKVLSGERPQRPSPVDWCPDSIWSLVEQCWVQKSYLRPTASDIHKFLDHLECLRWVGLAWGKESFHPGQENESSAQPTNLFLSTPPPSKQTLESSPLA